MRCDQAKEHIVDYLYHELSSEQERELEEHLAQCWGCTHELESLQETLSLVTSHIVAEDEESLWQESWTKIQTELPRSRASASRRSGSARVWSSLMDRINPITWQLRDFAPRKAASVLGTLTLAILFTVVALNWMHTQPQEALRGLQPASMSSAPGFASTLVGTPDAPYGGIRAAILDHRGNVSEPVTDELIRALAAYSGLTIEPTRLTADDGDLQRCVWAFAEGRDSANWSRASRNALQGYLHRGGFLIVVSHADEFAESVLNATQLEAVHIQTALQKNRALLGAFQPLSDQPVQIMLSEDGTDISGIILGPQEFYAWNPSDPSSSLSRLSRVLLSQLVSSQMVQWYPYVPVEVQGTLGRDNVNLDAHLISPDADDRVKLTVELHDSSGQDNSSKQTQIRHVELAMGSKERVQLSFPLSPERVLQTHVRYVVETSRYQYQQTRALRNVLSELDTRLLGQTRWQSGSPASFRVIAQDHATQQPVRGAVVLASFIIEDDEPYQVFKGRTDTTGSVALRIAPEQIPPHSTKLHIEVESDRGRDTFDQPIEIETVRKVLLSTDKPLYQPGQTMHIRSLSLNSADRGPISQADVTLEIEDAKGNKVFKESGQTDRFGIFAADFTIADEVNQGRYTVRVLLADAMQEKKVTVERYVLPKFKVQFETDRPYYQPGDTVKGEIQADYFFGKPVTEGQIEVQASKFDVGFDVFATVQGETDAEGHHSFELELPDAFVGQPLEQGNAFVQFEVSLVDGGEHKETISLQRQVVRSPIRILAVPESAVLDADMEGLVYVMTTSPDGKPLETEVTLKSGPSEKTQATDALGIATFRVRGGEHASIVARDTQGNRATTELSLERGDALILRTDRPIYQAGDTLKAQVIASQRQGVVYVDLIRAKQTILTKSVRIQDGKGDCEISLAAADAGTLTLHAYQITSGSDMLRDTRHVYVDPADDLQIDVHADKQSYLPGEEATLRVQVSDPSGHPVLAALGLWVVDESVFALQEMQPGLEKIYFTLEKELLKPRYEIHGFEMDAIVGQPLPKRQQRESAARVLMAAASRETPEYTLNVRSHDQKAAAHREALQAQVMPRAIKIAEAFAAHQQKNGWTPSLGLNDLVRAGNLKPADTLDPWGHAFYLGPDALYSVGPDGRLSTSDDVRIESIENDGRISKGLRRGAGIAGGRGLRARGRFMWGRQAPNAAHDAVRLPAMAMAAPEMEVASAMLNDDFATAFDSNMPLERLDGDSLAEVSSGAPEPRIRRYFPETLFTEAALITDERGQASFSIPLADSITTWRLTGMASSLTGQLGSTTSGLRVFQDFFVDIDLPVSLTQNDEVSIPIVVYNYLPGEQSIRLKLTQEDWFELLGETEQSIDLSQNQVRVRYYRIRVKKLGWHTLTVHAYGSQMSDAIARQIEITPDGKQHLVSRSDRLSGEVTQVIDIPTQAVDGASKILLKLYPGTFSQILEGMDSILAMPSGCFEQTSSATYPNILALDYIRATEKNTPEVEMKAHQYIGLGYQRLLSFEVDGGGFEWFGNAPANRILTAYGLMEFHDMSQVHDVDSDVIRRTQQWLMDQQGEDGSWPPDKAYLHAESWGRIQNSNLLPTAYITWALLESKATGDVVQKGLNYIRTHLKEANDAYTLGVCANALVRADRHHQSTKEAMRWLREKAVEGKDTAHWSSDLQTVTYSHGTAADVETTALITQAFLLYGKEAKLTNKALTYLVRAKDARGTWGSTQATILALKALLMASDGAQAEADAVVRIYHNGTEIDQVRITPETSDLMRLIDLGKVTAEGKNKLRLTWEGEGNCLYQVVGRYYLPWQKGRPKAEPLRIHVEYDKRELATDDLITCKVSVENLQAQTANMVIVDLGIPPGFEVLTPDLTELVGEYGLQKYNLTNRQIILYFDKLSSDEPVTFQYRLRAKFPIKAQTRMSRIYEYYNPEVASIASPVELVVR